MVDRAVPAEVQAAAEIVDRYLKGAPSVLATAQRPETAFERFARIPRSDKPVPQPEWKAPK
jgi:hypothetical protein